MAVGGMSGLMSSRCAKWAVLVLGNVSPAVRPEVSAAAELHVGTPQSCGEESCCYLSSIPGLVVGRRSAYAGRSCFSSVRAKGFPRRYTCLGLFSSDRFSRAGNLGKTLPTFCFLAKVEAWGGEVGDSILTTGIVFLFNYKERQGKIGEQVALLKILWTLSENLCNCLDLLRLQNICHPHTMDNLSFLAGCAWGETVGMPDFS